VAKRTRVGPNDDDSVGYMHPPRNTQFKPGQSGNPKGRPRAAKNLESELKKVLEEQLLVRENGKSRKRSKRDVLLRRLVHGGIEGDLRAVALAIKLSEEPANSRRHGSPDPVKNAEDRARVVAYIPDNQRRVPPTNLEAVAWPLGDLSEKIRKNDEVLVVLPADERQIFLNLLAKVERQLRELKAPQSLESNPR